MKKKIVFGLVLALILVSTFGAFAAGETKSKVYPWMASFDKPGQLNLYASAGFYPFGIDINVGPEYVFAAIEPGGVPLEFGATVRGLVGFSNFAGYANWVDWAVAPMATLHWGVDFGSLWKFDWYIGLGVGLSGTTGSYWPGGTAFGFASADGVAWHFSNNLALVIEYCYTAYMYAGGIGLKYAF